MYLINSSVDKPSKEYLLDAVKDMMKTGIKIGDLTKLYNDLRDKQDAYCRDIQVNYGIMNPNSSVQIINYMKSLDDSLVTTTCFDNFGKWTSNQDVLKQLSDMGYTFASDIIGYRKNKKYADSIKAIMDAADSDNRVHSNVSMTKTNRISYTDPALMTIPKSLIWDCIVPSKPGNVLISADIKNQEPNILINMLNIDKLKPALLSSDGLYETIFYNLPIMANLTIFSLGVDHQYIVDKEELKLHDNIPVTTYSPVPAPHDGIYVNGEVVKVIDTIPVATPLGHMPTLPDTVRVVTESGDVHEVRVDFSGYDENAAVKKVVKNGGIVTITGVINKDDIEVVCTPELRSEFKKCWNAMSYGASSLGVTNMCHHFTGNVLYKYFTSITELAEYRKDCERRARKHDTKTKTYFGTVLDAMESSTSRLKRILMDLPIQGTAADILALLVKHFDDETKARGIGDNLKIVFTRHDELIIEASSEFIEATPGGISGVFDIVKDITEHKVDDWEPFKLDIEVVGERDIEDIDESEDE